MSDQGYSDLTATRTFYVGSQNKPLGSLNYSIIDSVMSNLASTSKTACVGGRIELLIFGDPDSSNQRVVEAATTFDIDLERSCKNKSIIYIRLSAQWIRSKQALSRAEHQKSSSTHSQKNQVESRVARSRTKFVCQGDCITGHAMSILVSPPPKTIEYYEPNGKSVKWYPVVAAYLDRLFATLPMFPWIQGTRK